MKLLQIAKSNLVTIISRYLNQDLIICFITHCLISHQIWLKFLQKFCPAPHQMDRQKRDEEKKQEWKHNLIKWRKLWQLLKQVRDSRN